MEGKRRVPVLGSNTWLMIESFLVWLNEHGHETYDSYDFWATRYGILARKLYYQNFLLGAICVLPILFLDIVWPQSRSFLVNKKRYPTADAQIILGLLNLYSIHKLPEHLAAAVSLGRDLVASSIPGFSGYAWGYPFDWQNNRGLWKKQTPFVTVTPYCFEAFFALYDVTQNVKYLEIAASAARFVARDMNETVTSGLASATSYSPLDRSRVVNASAYRAFMLYEAFSRFGEEDYRKKAMRNLYFVLESQLQEGSWLYAMGNPKDAFIDHFHTCFVLKNLWKLNRRLKSVDVHAAIRKGYLFYRENLFDSRGFPKPFAIVSNLQLAKYEMYDFAEALLLESLLSDEIPGAYEFARHLAREIHDRFRLPDGHFVTRVNRFGLINTVPYLRWPQAQMFYALTMFLKAELAKSLLRESRKMGRGKDEGEGRLKEHVWNSWVF
jgi:hypothetical protein